MGKAHCLSIRFTLFTVFIYHLYHTALQAKVLISTPGYSCPQQILWETLRCSVSETVFMHLPLLFGAFQSVGVI